jgi:hypothetical protein
LLGNATALALIVSRRIYRSFPLFSSYLLSAVIEVGMSYSFREFSADRKFFLALSFVDSAFIVAVLGELSMSVLRPIRSSLPRWTPLAIAYLLAMAYAATWQFVKGPVALAWFEPYIANTICLTLSSSGLQIIFFIALAGVSRIAGIGWRSRELQIAAGLGSFSFVNFWITMIQLNYETTHGALFHRYHLLDELNSFGWGCLMLYWAVIFARKGWEREPSRFRKDL